MHFVIFHLFSFFWSFFFFLLEVFFFLHSRVYSAYQHSLDLIAVVAPDALTRDPLGAGGQRGGEVVAEGEARVDVERGRCVGRVFVGSTQLGQGVCSALGVAPLEREEARAGAWDGCGGEVGRRRVPGEADTRCQGRRGEGKTGCAPFYTHTTR